MTEDGLAMVEDILATDVEKLLREAGMEPAMRAAPTEAERQAAVAARRAGWNRSCLETVLKLRLTVDMITVVKERLKKEKNGN